MAERIDVKPDIFADDKTAAGKSVFLDLFHLPPRKERRR